MMSERKKEYQKEYARKNYERLRKYKTEWEKRKRAGMETRDWNTKIEIKEHGTRDACAKCGIKHNAHPRCEKCEILVHEGVLCVECERRL